MAGFAWRHVLAGFALLTLPGIATASWQGLVRLDDGAPFFVPARVTLTCPGQPERKTDTDLTGAFAFEGEKPREECIARAALPGYAPDEQRIANWPLDSRIPGLVLSRAGQFQGAAISVTFLGAPPGALDFYHRGLRALAAGSLPDAAELFEEAVGTDPTLADAWYQLGRLRLAANAVEPALEALTAAIEADSWFVPPYSPLLLIATARSEWSRVDEFAERVLAMNPYQLEAHYYQGLARFHHGDNRRARRSLEAIERNAGAQQFLAVHHLRGLLAEAEGNRDLALQEYATYLREEPQGIAAERVRARLAVLEENR